MFLKVFPNIQNFLRNRSLLFTGNFPIIEQKETEKEAFAEKGNENEKKNMVWFTFLPVDALLRGDGIGSRGTAVLYYG